MFVGGCLIMYMVYASALYCDYVCFNIPGHLCYVENCFFALIHSFMSDAKGVLDILIVRNRLSFASCAQRELSMEIVTSELL